jgi:uncharacterized protein (TIGR02301 family)
VRRPTTILCLLALLTGLVSGPALAQQRSGRGAAPAKETAREAAKEAPKEANAPADVPAPYDRDLLRMSEIIGALAFLRNLCGAPDASDWPARMKALIESEGVTPVRRDRLAGAYNRGYRGYALTYRVCTPAAHEAAARYVAEGDRLSHALAGRFGG